MARGPVLPEDVHEHLAVHADERPVPDDGLARHLARNFGADRPARKVARRVARGSGVVNDPAIPQSRLAGPPPHGLGIIATNYARGNVCAQSDSSAHVGREGMGECRRQGGRGAKRTCEEDAGDGRGGVYFWTSSYVVAAERMRAMPCARVEGRASSVCS